MHITRRFLKKRNKLAQRYQGDRILSSNFDIWLTRISSLSQPLLFGLAIFGYVYTVLPVYQKELLSEQIASKEIELNKLQSKIEESSPLISNLSAQVISLKDSVSMLDKKRIYAEIAFSQLEAKRSVLEGQNKVLNAQVIELSNSSIDLSKKASDISRRVYHDGFYMSTMIRSIDTQDPYAIISSPTIDGLKKFVVPPYILIEKSLLSGYSTFTPSVTAVPQSIKDEYHQFVRSRLMSRKTELSKRGHDLDILLLEIKREIKEAEATPHDKGYNPALSKVQRNFVEILYNYKNQESERAKDFFKDILKEYLPHDEEPK